MRVLRDATEDEMIRAFVDAELDSPIYGPRYAGYAHKIGVDFDALLAPDASSLRARALRAVLDASSPHVIVEGHTRATAYVRALARDDEIEVIVGYSPALLGWHFF